MKYAKANISPIHDSNEVTMATVFGIQAQMSVMIKLPVVRVSGKSNMAVINKVHKIRALIESAAITQFHHAIRDLSYLFRQNNLKIK